MYMRRNEEDFFLEKWHKIIDTLRLKKQKSTLIVSIKRKGICREMQSGFIMEGGKEIGNWVR